MEDYNEHARLFMAEYQRKQQEWSRKEKRRMLWLGKFAFPKINTKKTKILFIPHDYRRYYIPVIEPLSFDVIHGTYSPFAPEPKHEVIDLNKWGYNGKHWRAIIRFGYYEKDDILLVCENSLIYQQKRVYHEATIWWTLPK
jgi:hypothetical protein